MNTDIEFIEYFAQAQLEALKERERQIVSLRYGLSGEDACTLAQVSTVIGVSRERIRQILVKSHRKILGKGKRQIKLGNTDHPCAHLLAFAQEVVRPNEDNSAERLADFVEAHLAHLPLYTHALPLAAHFAYPNKAQREQGVEEAKKHLKWREREHNRQRKQLSQKRKFLELLTFAVFPTQPTNVEASDYVGLNRQRDVSIDGEGKAGKFFSQKMNGEIQYESLMEKDFLLRLENLDDVIFYQEQPFCIAYNVNNKKYTYYPDIFLILKDGRGIIVEIKPVFKMALRTNLAKWTALKERCAQQGLGLLVTDGRCAIQQIQHHKFKPEFGNAVLKRLQSGGMNWTDYQAIKNTYQPNRNDFVALVLKYRLTWHLSPFTLEA